ncbi:hypothetical protein NW062_06670 [Mycoplasmopsis cynos]|nr:hypothetical protein NW062_06670 [Mycoplasmopsis cynos]
MINKLSEYAKGFDEVILGISPNFDGEIIKYVLRKYLKNNAKKISELAIGFQLVPQLIILMK